MVNLWFEHTPLGAFASELEARHSRLSEVSTSRPAGHDTGVFVPGQRSEIRAVRALKPLVVDFGPWRVGEPKQVAMS